MSYEFLPAYAERTHGLVSDPIVANDVIEKRNLGPEVLDDLARLQQELNTRLEEMTQSISRDFIQDALNRGPQWGPEASTTDVGPAEYQEPEPGVLTKDKEAFAQLHGAEFWDEAAKVAGEITKNTLKQVSDGVQVAKEESVALATGVKNELVGGAKSFAKPFKAFAHSASDPQVRREAIELARADKQRLIDAAHAYIEEYHITPRELGVTGLASALMLMGAYGLIENDKNVNSEIALGEGAVPAFMYEHTSDATVITVPGLNSGNQDPVASAGDIQGLLMDEDGNVPDVTIEDDKITISGHLSEAALPFVAAVALHPDDEPRQPSELEQPADLVTSATPQVSDAPAAPATPEVSSQTPEHEQVSPEVQAVNNALAEIKLGHNNNLDTLVQAVTNMYAAYAPNDKDRPSDMPEGYVKFMLPHEANGISVPFTIAQRTADNERYTSPHMAAVQYATAKLYQDLIKSEFKHLQGDMLRVRDLNSPGHKTHNDGRHADVSGGHGWDITQYSTGAFTDFEFSERFDKEFTMRLAEEMARMYSGGQPVVDIILSSGQTMVPEINERVGRRLMVNNDPYHKDHFHLQLRKDLALPQWRVRAGDLPWSVDQDLRIGGMAQDITPEQHASQHADFEEWVSRKLAAQPEPATPEAPEQTTPEAAATPELPGVLTEEQARILGVEWSIARHVRATEHFSVAEVLAQISAESSFNPDAVSDQGAKGVTQFMDATWEEWGQDMNDDGQADPFNVEENLDANRRYMEYLYEWTAKQIADGKISGDVKDLTRAAYNAGMGTVLDAGGVPDKEETLNYITRINERAAEYASKLGLEVTESQPPTAPTTTAPADVQATDTAAMAPKEEAESIETRGVYVSEEFVGGLLSEMFDSREDFDEWFEGLDRVQGEDGTTRVRVSLSEMPISAN